MNEEKQEEKTEEEILKEEEIQTNEETDYKDKYFRLLAENENARKRLQKERHEMTRFAIENVLSEVLLPIDTLESALGFTEQMSEDTRNWVKGFDMILNQFKEILHTHNVVAFHSKGERFDPHKHEAVEVEETHEHPEGMILQEFLKGYKSGDRILRAARVKVAKPPKTSQKEESEEIKDKE